MTEGFLSRVFALLGLMLWLLCALGPVSAASPDTIYVDGTTATTVPDTLECNHVYTLIINNPNTYLNGGYSTNTTRYVRLVSRSGGAIYLTGDYDLRIGSNNDRIQLTSASTPATSSDFRRSGYLDTVVASGAFTMKVNTYSANNSSTPHSGFAFKMWVCCTTNEVQNISVSSITPSSAQVSWNDVSGATRWVVYYGYSPNSFDDSVVTTTTSATLTGLFDRTPYHLTICNNANTHATFDGCRPNNTTFLTAVSDHLPTGCVNYLAIHSSSVEARYGTYHAPGSHIGVVDYGASVKSSRHTIHRDTTERDPRTGGLLRTVPTGAEASVRLGNWNGHNEAEQLQYTLVVDTTVSDLLLLRYAAVLQNPTHTATVQPRVEYAITHLDGTPVGADGCYDVEFVANASLDWNSYNDPSGRVLWKDWTSVGVNLSGLHGDTIRITLTTKDCNESSSNNSGTHFGYAYFTLSCGSLNIDFSGCHASEGDVISAPEGFTYSWHKVGETTVLGTDRTFSVPSMGNYVCDMQFVGASGATCTFSLNANASGQYPVADYTYSVTALQPDTFSVAFTDASVIYNGATPMPGITPSSYQWFFPDGTTATGSSVTHQFNQAGSYDVMLVVDLDGSCPDTIVHTVLLRSSIVRPDNIDSVDCAFTPTSTDWSIRLDAVVGGSTTGDSICTLINPLVGDLDGDGVAEIVCFSTRNAAGDAFTGNGNPGSKVKNVVVYDGRTLRLKAKFDLPSPVSAFEATPFGLARPYGGDALMVFACTDNNLYAYKLTGTLGTGNFGATQVWGPVSYGSGNDYATVVGFVDFNNDSIPEVYVRNKIFNLETGELLLTVISSNGNTGSTYAHVGSGAAGSRKPLAASFASDVVGDQKCELLLGNEIYSISLTNIHGTAGNSATLYATAPSTGVSGITSDGHVQVADFNLDGHLDIFFSSRPLAVNSATVYAYVWDVYNNTVSTPVVQPVTAPGKSIPLIADIDNDDSLEVVIHCGVPGYNVRAYKYHAATQSFSLFWTKSFSEDSYSNSLTLFDFNQDGENELLICDQNAISIVNGSTPALAQTAISTLAFREVTIMQYPVIADVDNDGAAEIVFVGKQNSMSYQGTLNVCRSNGDPWAPARPVWNQYLYNVTHINRDLTVPAVLFNNATPFVDPDDATVIRRPYNHFLQQSTSLDGYGRPYYTASDLQPGSYSAELTDAGIHLIFDICNVGLSRFSADTIFTQIYVDSYGGTRVANILTIGELGLPIQIQPDSCRTVDIVIPYSRICPHLPMDSLVFALNDSGNGVAALGLPAECSIDNNFFSIPNDVFFHRDTISDSVCRGVHYDRNGFDVPDDTTARLGIHWITDTISDPVHCYTIRTLQLKVNDSFVVDTVASACDGMEWRGHTFARSGEYGDTTHTAMGCDSIVVLHLTVNQNWTVDTMATVCDSIVWYDTTLVVTDTVAHNFQTVAGCDSTVTLYLNVNYSYDADSTQQTCGVFVWEDGQTFSASGDYTLTYTTVDGCDSVWHLHLDIHHDTLVEFLYEACDTVAALDRLFTADTLILDTLTTVYGCDSIISWQITVFPSYNDTIVDSIPLGASYTFNGAEYTDSGAYQALLTSVHQCDSTVTLLLYTYDLCAVFLQFPNLVTPNGDDINDRFVIKNLIEEGCYPINHLTIYNRWGARVYDVENIHDDSQFWDPAADRMPAGTYFYTFRAKGHKGRMERHGVIEVIK